MSQVGLERRKLQEIPGGSFTITLPRWWVGRSKLKKGSEIIIAQDGLSLKLFPTTAVHAKYSPTIDKDIFPDITSIKYCIWTYYMQGAERIEVRSKKIVGPEEKRVFRAVRLELPGIDVINEDSSSISLGVTAEASQLALDEAIKRMAGFSLEIYQDALRTLSEANKELAREVVERGGEILRHYRAMIRQIVLCTINPEVAYRSGVKDSRELVTYALLARDLSRTVHHAMYIARHVQSIESLKVDASLLKLFKEMSDVVQEMQRYAVESFLERSFGKVLKVVPLMERVRQIERRINLRILKAIKDVETVASLVMLAREIRRIAGYSVAMADDAANRILTPEQAFPTME